MPGPNKPKKAKIQMEKPEPPAFIQRMKEQIVAQENTERRERSDARRRARPDLPDDPDDDPAIVKLRENDLTEADYRRMKEEYRLGQDAMRDRKHTSQELDIDQIMSSRKVGLTPTSSTAKSSHDKSSLDEPSSSRNQNQPKAVDRAISSSGRRVLSYSSSSDEDD